jgi:cytochrome P450
MDRPPPLRRLIDLPGVADLEYRALLKREFAEREARAEHPEIDECSLKNLGLTADQAEDHPRPTNWDRAERLPIPLQVVAFEAEGWDVTDDKRRPLRVLGHFNQQLWLAIRGVAGSLPFQPDDDRPDPWGSSLAAEASRFRKR